MQNLEKKKKRFSTIMAHLQVNEFPRCIVTGHNLIHKIKKLSLFPRTRRVVFKRSTFHAAEPERHTGRRCGLRRPSSQTTRHRC